MSVATVATPAESVRRPLAAAVMISDLDALLQETSEEASRGRLRRLGLELGAEALARLRSSRTRLMEAMDRRWSLPYERAHQRYGRAVAAVRERVCSGCFVTLPTIARPRDGGHVPHICQSCGRILYWI